MNIGNRHSARASMCAGEPLCSLAAQVARSCTVLLQHLVFDRRWSSSGAGHRVALAFEQCRPPGSACHQAALEPERLATRAWAESRINQPSESDEKRETNWMGASFTTSSSRCAFISGTHLASWLTRTFFSGAAGDELFSLLSTCSHC